MIAKKILMVLLGFGGGIIIAGAVFAFIAVIGVVPRLAQKTKTVKYIKIYEEAIIFGGIMGVLTLFTDFYIPIGSIATIIFAFCIGIFYGVLAVSLAEILNVIPILTRRGAVQKGIQYFIISLAIGKLIGSVLYYSVFGFYGR